MCDAKQIPCSTVQCQADPVVRVIAQDRRPIVPVSGLQGNQVEPDGARVERMLATLTGENGGRYVDWQNVME
jgi:hypothetical protein